MRNTLILALFAGALAIEASPALAQTTQEPMTSKAAQKAQRKARRQNGPEVYKGSVAEQRRIVTDAAGSQRDEEADADAKAAKKMKKAKN